MLYDLLDDLDKDQLIQLLQWLARNSAFSRADLKGWRRRNGLDSGGDADA